MRTLWIILIFLVIGGFIIANSYNLNLKKSDDRKSFIGKFSIWVVGVGKNVARTVGYAIKLDWLPETSEEGPSVKEKLINYSNYVVENI
ncbi:MAG: hypothetical protein ABIJ08_02990 [Nanoarchaeota archaeon]